MLWIRDKGDPMKTCKCGNKIHCKGKCLKCYNAILVKARSEVRKRRNELLYFQCRDCLRNRFDLKHIVSFKELTDKVNDVYNKQHSVNKIIWILTKNNKPHWLIKEKVCKVTYLSYDWSVEG